jgi:hypothetical protein
MDRRQQRTLESFGYAIEMNEWKTKDGRTVSLKTTPKADYITADGRILRGLPADSYHLQRYLSRGFKLVGTKKSEPLLVCEICGKEFKHKIALAGHMRTHLKKGGKR